MNAEEFDTATQLMQAGRKQAAVPVLRAIIQRNPVDEQAWLLLSECMDELEHKKFCLEKVLAINPVNWEARDALAALKEPAEYVPLEPAPPREIPREKMEWEQDQANEPDLIQPFKLDWEEDDAPQPVPVALPKRKPVQAPVRSIPRHKAPRKRIPFFSALMLAVLFLMLITVGFVFMHFMGIFSLMEWLPWPF